MLASWDNFLWTWDQCSHAKPWPASPHTPGTPRGGHGRGEHPAVGIVGTSSPCCWCDFGRFWVKSCTRAISPLACTEWCLGSSGLCLAQLCCSHFDFTPPCAQQWAGDSPSQPQPCWDAFSRAALVAVLILNKTRSGIPFPFQQSPNYSQGWISKLLM